MTDRERFLACMSYRSVDRPPYWSWGAWPETVERWKREGYSPGHDDIDQGADKRHTVSHWFYPCPPFEHKVVEDAGDHVLYVNRDGILMRELKRNPMSSMPQFVRFPVETREDFRRFWRERMQPDMQCRGGPGWQDRLRALRADPVPLIIVAGRWGGFFGPLRNLVGVERLCVMFHDDPAFVEEMMDADAELIIAVMDQVLNVVSIDAFAMWEDMAFRTGPLISPAMARRYMLPRYRMVVEHLRRCGVEHIGLDSDGNVECLIPVWIDAGLDFLYPFEPQAGMDVVAVRRRFGRDLRMWGGIDKRCMAAGPQAIDAEIARVAPVICDGGYVAMPDHWCPPDISWDNYRYFMRRLGEVCRSGTATLAGLADSTISAEPVPDPHRAQGGHDHGI